MILNTRRMTLAATPPARSRCAARRRAAPKAGEPLKIGFVYVSPIGDAGWTFQHDTGPQGDGKGARRQGHDQVHRKRARRRRCGARDPRARADRPQPHLHDVVRLHEPDDQGRAAVPQQQVRARHRLQDVEERRHLQRALLRGPLSRGHRRRQDVEDGCRGLRRRVSDSGSRHGHQRVRARHAQRQSEGRGEGDLGQLVVRSGQGVRSRRTR